MPTRPRPLTVRLPRSDRSFGPALAGSAAVHALLILTLIWRAGESDQVLVGLAEYRSPGGVPTYYLELPSHPRAQAEGDGATARPTVALPQLPRPQLRSSAAPAQRPLPPLEVSAAGIPSLSAERFGAGRTVTAGAGQLGGLGDTAGPGTGDARGRLLLPQPRELVLPPQDAPPSIRGRELSVRLWIDAQGRVTRVEVDPPIADEGYRRRFLARMAALSFYPARDRGGRPVEAQIVLTVVIG